MRGERLEWQRSSTCPPNVCVEVARKGRRILIREAERPRVIVQTGKADWRAFLDGVKRGEFDHFGR